MKHNKKRGFALTEVLLAIAVIVIIGIAAYPLFKNARTNSQVEQIANDVTIVQKNIQILYSGQSSYNPSIVTGSQLTGTLLKSLNLLPDDISSTDNINFTSPLGTTFLVSTNAGLSTIPEYKGFTIGVGVPSPEFCVKLTERLAPEFDIVSSNSDSGNIIGAAAGNNKVINITALTANCRTITVMYFTSR